MMLRVVCDERSGEVIGSTRYYDIVPAVSRVEIGYTLVQRSLAAHPSQHGVQIIIT